MVKCNYTLLIIKENIFMKRNNFFLLSLFLLFFNDCSTTLIKVLIEENLQLKQYLVEIMLEKDDLSSRLERLHMHSS